MDFHFASLWETIADHVPGRPALVSNGIVRTWAEYDDRAARLASVLAANGIGPGSNVGLYLHNCNEYLEAQYAAFKLCAGPVNVNYRYKADELVYLLDNADVEALVFQGAYAMRIWEIRKRLPKLKLLIQVDDGTETLLPDTLDYARSIQRASPAPRITRSPDDVYMLYTGGTTGLPKGVMYPVGEFALFLARMAATARELPAPQTLADVPALLDAVSPPPVSLPACPLMHGTGMWLGSMLPLGLGGTVVTTPKLGLDPDLLWELVEAHQVSDLVIVGDAFARPLLEALDHAAARGTPYDLGSLRQITSSGVMWSSEVKRGLLGHQDLLLMDVFGSSEGGMGRSVATREARPDTAKFMLNDGVRVITDDGRDVVPGSGEIGRLATGNLVPLGYYKDPEKSAATFREVDGARMSFPGDYATVAADGSIMLLGRGSGCINTAGEKVFPEEVEETLKRHPSVVDCLVVGLPDTRFGERVIAVVAVHGAADAEDEWGVGLAVTGDAPALLAFAHDQLAGYKVPKSILFVDRVRRAPNGQADYRWARSAALAEFGSEVVGSSTG